MRSNFIFGPLYHCSYHLNKNRTTCKIVSYKTHLSQVRQTPKIYNSPKLLVKIVLLKKARQTKNYFQWLHLYFCVPQILHFLTPKYFIFLPCSNNLIIYNHILSSTFFHHLDVHDAPQPTVNRVNVYI